MRKVRAVIDTNVFVSGIISPKGAPRKILDLARKEVFKVLTSATINHEILNVLHRNYIYTKYNLNEMIIDDITSFLYEGTIITEEKVEVLRIKKDFEDNKFLGCAIEGEADCIISGDEHLLAIKYYKGIQIIDPKTFLKILESAQDEK